MYRLSQMFIVSLLAFIGTACWNCSSNEKETKKGESPVEDIRNEGDNPGDQTQTDRESSESKTQNCSKQAIPSLGGEPLVEGHTFNKPLFLTQTPGDNQTFYVVERPGIIQRVKDGTVLEEPFLDIRSKIEDGFNEQGLLGLAFHPDYQQNGRFFVYYTSDGSPTRDVVAEYHRSEQNPSIANPEEVRRFLEPDSLEDNHNGGMLTFGPDGYLYAAFGDGGGAGDDHGEIGNGLNKETVLGSIVRIDVDSPGNEFVPSDNPFAGDNTNGSPYIWAYGLRNPWRFSFDNQTGDLWIADVGQNEIEEINVEKSGSDGGRNYGWRAYEGSQVYDESVTDLVDDHHAPIIDIPHASDSVPVRSACSVTGGYVYRGEAIPKLEGIYLYGDYCSQDVAAVQYCDGEVVQHKRIEELNGLGQGLASFGQDNDGELYLIYIGSGEIKKIVKN